jgi:beta-glucanase (GH16 family)
MKKTGLFLLALCAGWLLTGCAPKTFSKLIFEDHFNGEGLPDGRFWGYEEGYIRNGEKQYYTVARPENCFMENGFLHLVVRNDSALIDGKIRPITSASIHTKGKKEWKYGKIEIRAKLPGCLGTWPAFWMMPVTDIYGKWPKSGEIDIMENVGYEPDKLHYTIHSEKYNHTKDTQKTHSVECSTATTGFHVFALQWSEKRFEWFLDGEKQYTIEKTEDGWEAWPFDHPFYLLINSAFGGGWGGKKGIDLSQLPQDFVIDYVKVYQ